MKLKELVQDSISSLPDDSSADDIIEHIRFVESVQKGIEQADKGELISNEKARKFIDGTLDIKSIKEHY